MSKPKPILIVEIPYETHSEDLCDKMHDELSKEINDYHVIVIGSYDYDFKTINLKILQPL